LAQVGEFAARLGHELKNPLASVLVALQLIERSAAVHSSLRTIARDAVDELRTASRALNDLLDRSRRAPYSPTPVAVVPFLNDAIDPYRVLAAEKRIAILLDGPADPELWLVVDATWLHRAIANLLVNALEASPPGTVIHVGARVLELAETRSEFPGFAGDLLVIEVQDGGPGIPEEHRDRVFEPFFSTKPKGTGLGLAVVQDFVHAHGGAIGVDSAPNRGTRFSLFFAALGANQPCRAPYGLVVPCGEPPLPPGFACWVAHRRNGSLAAHSDLASECMSCAVFERAQLARYGPTSWSRGSGAIG